MGSNRSSLLPSCVGFRSKGVGLTGVHQDIAGPEVLSLLSEKTINLSSRGVLGPRYQKYRLFSDVLVNFLFLPQWPQKLAAELLLPFRMLHIDGAHRWFVPSHLHPHWCDSGLPSEPVPRGVMAFSWHFVHGCQCKGTGYSPPSWGLLQQLAPSFYREGRLISRISQVLCWCCLI